MTYCLGLYLEEGLIFLSDTRTNAGVDNVSTYCKMNHFHENHERLIVLLSSFVSIQICQHRLLEG